MSALYVSDDYIEIDKVVKITPYDNVIVFQEMCDQWYIEELDKEALKQIIEQLTKWHDKL